jgi:AhpD family alkylhydroperoxidase
MEKLTYAERELVALGAAMGSNCVPCIEYHIPEARKAGLTEQQIREAIQLADKVRQVPARKVLAVATALLAEAEVEAPAEESRSGCGQPGSVGNRPRPCCG